MIARVLPPEEWHRLRDNPISELVEFVKPEDVRIVVVEHDDQIVATWSALRITHVEGVWVHPEHRSAGVVRSLLRATADATKEWAPVWLMTAAATDEVREILSRLNAIKLPMEPYVLSISEFGGN